ncbi:MAG TPA: hypothetical protein VGV10_01925 [Thermoleophilaceae bacterium]|nr:hypothetical protein [Thermoleophilaceae bacterium]
MRAHCPPGKKAIGGGHELSGLGSPNRQTVEDSRPVKGTSFELNTGDAPDGWHVLAEDPDALMQGGFYVTAYAICANVS